MRTFEERYQELEIAATAGNVTTTIIVPGREWWKVLTYDETLTTDATVATRVPHLSFQDANAVAIARMSQISGTAASSGHTHTWGVGLTTLSAASAGLQTAALPPIWLRPGWRIVFAILNGQAGDTVTAMRMLYETYETGPERGPRSNYPQVDLPGEFYLPGLGLYELAEPEV